MSGFDFLNDDVPQLEDENAFSFGTDDNANDYGESNGFFFGAESEEKPQQKAPPRKTPTPRVIGGGKTAAKKKPSISKKPVQPRKSSTEKKNDSPSENKSQIDSESSFSFLSESNSKTDVVGDYVFGGDLPDKKLMFVSGPPLKSETKPKSTVSYEQFELKLFQLLEQAKKADSEQLEFEKQIEQKDETLQLLTHQENFTEAGKVHNEIQKLKSDLVSKKSIFIDCLLKSFAHSVESFTLFELHSTESKESLDHVTQEIYDNEKLLEKLKEIQEYDTNCLQVEKEKINEELLSLKTPVEDMRTMCKINEQTLEDEITSSHSPFKEQISTYQGQILDCQNVIKNLLAQIKQQEELIKGFKNQIQEVELKIAEVDKGFVEKKKNLATQKQDLSEKEKQLKESILKLEAPFAQLVQSVEKRTQQITKTENNLSEQRLLQSNLQNEDLENTRQLLQSAINPLVEYPAQRNETSKKIQDLEDQLQKNSLEKEDIDNKILEYKAKIEQLQTVIGDAKIKIPSLEAAKKAAISSKNFRSAQQVSTQLKEINELVSNNESSLNSTQLDLAQVESKKTQIEGEIQQLQIKHEELKTDFERSAYEFFEVSLTRLSKVFEVSNFCSELLGNLEELLRFVFDRTPKVENLTKEMIESRISELEKQVNDAAEAEDFNLADSLQSKIETLQAKLITFK